MKRKRKQEDEEAAHVHPARLPFLYSFVWTDMACMYTKNPIDICFSSEYPSSGAVVSSDFFADSGRHVF